MSGRSLACIIGWPVSASLSPAIHNAAFAAAGLGWIYVPLGVRPGAAAEGVALLRALAVEGANVTMPHKEDVVAHLDAVAGEAAAAGAVNTIVRDGRRLVGHNTDGEGFLRSLRSDAAMDPAGAAALILGAGGSAAAIAVALAGAGAAVTVSARRRERAAALAARAGAAVLPWDAASAKGFDLVVHATPARDGVPAAGAGPGQVVFDLIYQPPETILVAGARAAGARACDGLGMLIHQAALSFELWTGVQAPLGVMRAAAEDALAAARFPTPRSDPR